MGLSVLMGVVKFIGNVLVPGGGFVLSLLKMAAGLAKTVLTVGHMIKDKFKTAQTVLDMKLNHPNLLETKINLASKNLYNYYRDENLLTPAHTFDSLKESMLASVSIKTKLIQEHPEEWEELYKMIYGCDTSGKHCEEKSQF
jgi:hypothetical protein